MMLFLLLVALPAYASSWDDHWQGCYDVALPGFQRRLPELKKLLQQGKEWDSAVSRELADVDRIATQTCEKWSESANGDTILARFTRELGVATTGAFDLKKTADGVLLAGLESSRSRTSTELALYGLKMEDIPCGEAFRRSELHVSELVGQLEQSFYALRAKCPHAADATIAEATAKGLISRAPGKGADGPARVPSGKAVAPSSDITGTKRSERSPKKNP